MTVNISNGTNSSFVQSVKDKTYEQYIEPSQLVTLRRVVFSFVVILAFMGNTIVIRAIRTKSRSRKPLTHYLVTCLAIAEIFNSFFMIFVFVQEEAYHWPFGTFLCHLVVPGCLVTFSVTTAILVCISLYRYRVLVTPYKKPPSRKACLIIVGGIWVYSFMFSIPSILTMKLVPFKEPFHLLYQFCYMVPPLPTYNLVRVICQFFIPMIIMFIGYSVASFKIKEHMTFMEARRQIRINSNLSTLNTYLDSQDKGCDGNFLTVPINQPQPILHLQPMSPRESLSNGVRRSVDVSGAQATVVIQRTTSMGGGCDEGEHMIETERDIIKMFYVIVLVFLFCYIPYQVLFILDHFSIFTYENSPCFSIIRNYAFLLTTMPSALHPLCYGTMSRFYARAFSKLILCKCNK